jgi:alpha-L-rhamnosidase
MESHLKQVMLGLVLLNIGVCTFAVEMKIHQGVKGIWMEPGEKESPSFAWQSQWIWLNETIGSDVMLARRSFELDHTPLEALLRITASTTYQLYLNGEYINRGPARSAPHHQSYDILDVRGLLREGKNTIAIRVYHQPGKRSYHFSGRAGLLAQLDIYSNAGTISIGTDDGWKVTPDASWDKDAPRINRFQLAVCDRIDMRKQVTGWNMPGFNDASWSDAETLMRTDGWPLPQENARAQTLTPPWTSLLPRDIPYLLEAEEQAVNLISAMQIDGFVAEISDHSFSLNPIPVSGQIDEPFAAALPAYRKGNTPLMIPASDEPVTWLLLFDFGKVLNGMPNLDIEGQAGTRVDILGAPFMVDGQFTHKVVDSDFRDRIVLSGNRDIWEATCMKPVRYMGMVVRSTKQPIRLYAAGIKHVAYPFERKGHIKAPGEPWVEQYTEATARTIRVCTTDAYTDNYRERRQYAQTGYYAALGNHWIFGDLALQRRYLIQVAQEQEANGMMPAYAPLAADDYMVIMDANCLWIRGLHNYFLYSGDSATIRQLLPAATKLLDLLHGYTNSMGLLDQPPYPYWLDHARLDRRGANFCLNGHYLGALEDFATLLDWLNEPGYGVYLDRAGLLRQSLKTHFWDPEKKLFSDAFINGERSNMFSEHANAMALAMKVATPAQVESVAQQILAPDQHNYIQRKSGMTMVTPAMSYFLHKGLCDQGYIDESFMMLRNRFDRMLAPGTNGTLWEEWWLDGTGRSGTFQKGRTRSDAQTESAFPPALFSEYLLGIRPIMPGMKKIRLFLPHSGLRQVEGLVPTPRGMLLVRWSLDENGGGQMDLEIPGVIMVELDLVSLGIPDGQQILIDGQAYKLETGNTSLYLLSEGRHHVKF